MPNPDMSLARITQFPVPPDFSNLEEVKEYLLALRKSLILDAYARIEDFSNYGTPITAEKITEGAVTESKLADEAVTESKIADGAVTESKLTDEAITEAKLAVAAVTEAKIAADAITQEKIANAAITASKIGNAYKILEIVDSLPAAGTAGRIVYLTTDGKIYRDNGTAWKQLILPSEVTNHLGGEGIGTIGTVKIDTGAITEAKIAAGAITETKIADNAISSPKIVAGAILADKIAAGAITTEKLDALAITADKIAANAITTAKLAAGAVTTEKLVAGSVTSDILAANSVIAGKIAAGAVYTDQLAAQAVTAAKIAAGTITADKLAFYPSQDGIEDNILRIARPGGASYSGIGTIVGAIVITLPQSWTNTMMNFEVDVYHHTASKSFTLYVAGFNYATSSTWLHCSANLAGDVDADNRVRFGHDGTKCCIVIGETNSSWYHPKISVRNFKAGGSNFTYDQWKSGWSISIMSNLTGYTFTQDFSDSLIDAGQIKNQGALALLNSISSTHIDDNAVTTPKIYANAVTTAKIAAGAVTADKISVDYLSAINANMGTLTAGKIDVGNIEVNADTERILLGAATGPLTGTGIFIGKDGSDYEFRCGNPSGHAIHWDGSELNFYRDDEVYINIGHINAGVYRAMKYIDEAGIYKGRLIENQTGYRYGDGDYQMKAIHQGGNLYYLGFYTDQTGGGGGTGDEPPHGDPEPA